MKITVILSTHNRCQTLAKTLEGIAKSLLPDSVSWEVLVVDNNSNDHTRDVVEDFRLKHPSHFRYLFESRLGKSHALNTGVLNAKGDVLAFTDDNITVEPTWLWNLTAVLDDDQWAGTGGRILPTRTFLPPQWMSPADPWMGVPLFNLFDLGDKRSKLDQAPYVLNMAFRKKVFEKYGGFRTDLGPPSSDLRGEDTEFGYRLIANGEQLLYEPSAVVRHPVMEDRLEKKYFLNWWFKEGRYNVRKKGDRPCLWRVPQHYISFLNHAFHLLPRATFRWIRTSNQIARFKRKCRMWMIAGETMEIICQSRGKGLGDAIKTSGRCPKMTRVSHPRVNHNELNGVLAGALPGIGDGAREALYAATESRPPIPNIHTPKQAPLFSIILPTRDRPAMLQRAVSSVFRQDLKDFELIVIDDGSAEPCSGLPRDPRIRLIKNRYSLGVAQARNVGIDAAKGTHISFLDDDDEYLSSFLSSSYTRLKRSPEEVGVSWCGVNFIDYFNESRSVVVRTKRFATHRYRLSLFTDFLSIGAGYGVTMKAECLRRVGPFNSALKVGEDTDMFFRILVEGFEPVTVPGVHVACHNHRATRLTGIEMHQEMIQTCEWLWTQYSDFLFEHPVLRNNFRHYIDSLKKSDTESQVQASRELSRA